MVYEVVWARMLVLIFGATVLGVSTVLATFMGGLALGSYLAGRIADRYRSPLRLYALLEAGIGLYALVVPAVFRLVEQAYVGFYQSYLPSFVLLSLFRLGLSVGALILPTTLMGGTLPVLSRYFVRSSDRIGRGIGWLYALNTFGAVIGAFSAGFVLIPSIGLALTSLVAAGVNLVVSATALMLARRQESRELVGGRLQAGEPPREDERAIWPGAVLLASAVSGFASLVYEVAWTRGLEMVFGGSAYAFSTMLTAFLLGIAIGGAVGAQAADKARDRVRLFVVLELVIAGSALAVAPLIGRMPLALVWVFDKAGAGFAPFQAAVAVGCIGVMLAPTVCMGATFPVAARLYTSSVRGIGAKVGNLYAANTVGTIVGSLAGGFALIPLVGPERTIGIAASANVLSAALVMQAGRQVGLGQSPLSAVAGVAILMCAAFMPRWDPRVSTSGLYVYGHELVRTTLFRQNPMAGLSLNEVVYYKDGLTAAVSVRRLRTRERTHTSLAINGKTDASDMDLNTQLLLAHLPILLYASSRTAVPGQVLVPKDVLVIGLGSGCTAGAVLRYPVRSLECVEIEPAVVEASRFFTDINRSYWKDRRFRLVVGDGRNHVMMTPKQYDCIISEPSNPWISGVSNLFTKEHYQRVRSRLKPGGVFCQWLPAYYMSPRDMKMAIGTFVDVFPEASLWCFPPMYTDVFLVASNRPLTLDADGLAAAVRTPWAGPDLAKMGLSGLWGILQGFVMDGEDLRAYSRGADRHTDNRPLLEFTAARSVRLPVGDRTIDGLFGSGDHSAPMALRAARSEEQALRRFLGLAVPVDGLWRLAGASLVNRHKRVDTPDGGSKLIARVRPQVILRNNAVEANLSCTFAARPLPWDRDIRKVMGPDAVSLPSASISGHSTFGLWSVKDGTCSAGATWHCPGLKQQFLLKLSAPAGRARDLVAAWRGLASAFRCEHAFP
ncbi:MAG: fused MFS/spermidine synthase [Armatimonadota bacterium]